MANPRDHLRRLLEPTSIAIVGASDRLGPGRQVMMNLEQLGFRGDIVPINPKYDRIGSRRCYSSLTEAHAAGYHIDAAAVLLGRDRINQVLEEAGSVGVKGAWAFASGFSEAGADGQFLQEELAAVCRRHGMAFCGPNCVGLLSPAQGVAAFSAPISPSLKAGNVSAVAQSGSICLALANSARGIGFRFLVSSGNEAVIDIADYIDYFLEDDKTEVVLAFIEQLRSPRRFIDVAKKARKLGKPLIALKVGRSEVAQRATIAHTGALAGADDVYDAIFNKYGVIRVGDLDEMMETAEAFSQLRRNLPQGSRIGMLTVSGGEISLIADLAEGLGFQFPEWSAQAREVFANVLPPYADIANPLDAWGSGRVEETYARCVDTAVTEDVDIVVISQDAPSGMALSQVDQYKAIADAVAIASIRSGKPIVAIRHLSGGLDSTLCDGFAAGHVPLLQGSREGLLAVHHLIQYRSHVMSSEIAVGRDDQRRGSQWLAHGDGPLDEVVSKQVFREYGIPCADEQLCKTSDETAAAAQILGYPVVLKVISPDLLHKTDAGGVALHIEDEAALRRMYETLLDRTHHHVTNKRIQGVLVQRMIEDPVAEALVGVMRDQTFGPVVVFGLGGIHVELFKDRAIGVPPLSLNEARAMIASTKAAQLLAGFRGGKLGDVDALADIIVRIGLIASHWKERIAAIDINPVLILPKGQGVVAVDGLIELAGGQHEEDGGTTK